MVINLNQSKWTIPQKRVLITFGLVILLWVTRGLIVDYTGVTFKDSSVAILGAIMLFIIPSKVTEEKLLKWSHLKDEKLLEVKL